MNNCQSSASNPESKNSINLAALLASREKQDLLFNTQVQNTAESKSQAIIPIQGKKTYKSDIDTVLEGDF